MGGWHGPNLCHGKANALNVSVSRGSGLEGLSLALKLDFWITSEQGTANF
jgi:hypothetical protein